MVQKPDGRLRPCGDFRGLNNITVKNRYPLLSFRSFTHRLAGATVFSKIDLKKAYFQVPLSKDSIPKTAVITPFGCFEFLVLPFGLCNAVATFQRLSDTISAQGISGVISCANSLSYLSIITPRLFFLSCL